MRTAIVILNWNTREYLGRFLPGVVAEAERNPGTEVVVADNGSTDRSVELVKEGFSSVRVIAFEENLGFTGGYNRALSELQGFDLFLLLNSDIEVPQGWLRPLIEWMERHSECGACGPKLLSYYERDKFEYAGAAGGMLDAYGYPFCRGRVLKITEKDEGQYDSPKDVFWVSGACLMLRAGLWQELGGFDARFFAHQEEIDLCWRMQLRGWKVTVVPGSHAYHLGGGTLPKESPWKMKLNYRNSLLLLDNNLERTYALCMSREEEKRHPGEAKETQEKAGRKAGKPQENGLQKKAAGRARSRIRTRMLLDGMSAIIYLLGGKPSFFKAVIQAHREFKELKGQKPSPLLTKHVPTELGSVSAPAEGLNNGRSGEPGSHEVTATTQEKGNLSEIRIEGFYKGWIIPKAIFRGRKVFEMIHKL